METSDSEAVFERTMIMIVINLRGGERVCVCVDIGRERK